MIAEGNSEKIEGQGKIHTGIGRCLLGEKVR